LAGEDTRVEIIKTLQQHESSGGNLERQDRGNEQGQKFGFHDD
jgi:hypothetical protein